MRGAPPPQQATTGTCKRPSLRNSISPESSTLLSLSAHSHKPHNKTGFFCSIGPPTPRIPTRSACGAHPSMSPPSSRSPLRRRRFTGSHSRPGKRESAKKAIVSVACHPARSSLIPSHNTHDLSPPPHFLPLISPAAHLPTAYNRKIAGPQLRTSSHSPGARLHRIRPFPNLAPAYHSC